jgi:alanine racemase
MLLPMAELVWVELDASAPDHNLRELRKCLRNGVLLCAVIKGNAYGHGFRQIAGLVPSADWLAVNSLEEGTELRAMGEKRPVLVLGHVPLADLSRAAAAELDLTVYNRETLEALGACSGDLARPVRLHLKVETGTGRQGILPEEVRPFAEKLTALPHVRLAGVSTHFANIEDTLNHEYALGQLARFRQALKELKRLGVVPEFLHTASTAAAILFPRTHFNLVRAGIGVYGLWPSRETYLATVMGRRPLPELRPVLSWKTRIVQIKTLPEGSYVGYGCSYRTTRVTRVAVLPVGYADGYDRALGNSAYVLIQGRRAPVVGRVCMNLTMVDVTDIPQLRLEQEVVLLGESGQERISAETMAGWAGTISYEVVTRISPSLERKVVGLGLGRGPGSGPGWASDRASGAASGLATPDPRRP